MSLIKKSHHYRVWGDKLTLAVVINEVKKENSENSQFHEDHEVGDLNSENEFIEDDKLTEKEDEVDSFKKQRNLYREKNCHGFMQVQYHSFNLQKLLRLKLVMQNPELFAQCADHTDPLGETNFLPDKFWKDYAKEIKKAKEEVFEHVWTVIKRRRENLLRQLRAQNDGITYTAAEYFLMIDIEVAFDIPVPYGFDPVKSEAFKIGLADKMYEYQYSYHSNPPVKQGLADVVNDDLERAFIDGFIETEPLGKYILNTPAPLKAEVHENYTSSRATFSLTYRNRTNVVGYVKHLPPTNDAPQYWLYRFEHKYRSHGTGKKAPQKIRDALQLQTKNRFSNKEGLARMCNILGGIHFNNMYECMNHPAVGMTPMERFKLIEDAIQDACPTRSLDVIKLLISGKQHISHADIFEKRLCKTQLNRALELKLLKKDKKKECAYVINWSKFKRQMHKHEILAAGEDILIGN